MIEFYRKIYRKPQTQNSNLGDRYGNIISLERESVLFNANIKKLFEEAPSAFLDEKTREEMDNMQIGGAVNYYSAGTVEFVVDKNKIFTLEMNTRLQAKSCN